MRIENRLPSPALTSTLFAEAKVIANIQAGHAVTKNCNSTLYYNETSKYGLKTESMHVSAGVKTYVVGLFDQDVGKSERFFDSIKDCLEKMAKSFSGVTHAQKLTNIILNIKSTMTDSHIVNDGVDSLFEKWRKDLATENIGLIDLPEEDKSKIVSLNKLKCNLHFFFGLSEATEKGLK